MRCSKCKSCHVNKTRGQQKCLKCGQVDKRSLVDAVNVNKTAYTQGDGVYYDVNAFKREEVESMELLRVAAPEMLEALKEIFSYSEASHDDDGQILDSICEEAKAAIAKATGQEESE